MARSGKKTKNAPEFIHQYVKKSAMHSEALYALPDRAAVSDHVQKNACPEVRRFVGFPSTGRITGPHALS